MTPPAATAATTIADVCGEVHDRFADRWAEVGIESHLLWPDTKNEASPLRAALDAAWPAPRKGTHAAFELPDGRRALALPHRRGAMVLAITIATFPEIESAARVDERTLRDSFADLTSLAAGARTLVRSNERLETAYERINLLCRIARHLASDEPPISRAQGALDMLRQVLPFGWLALRFHPQRHADVAADLAAQTLCAGRMPFALVRDLHRLTDPLLQAGSMDAWARVHTPRDSDIARVSGGEIVADPVTHDGALVAILLAGNKLGPDPDVSSEDLQILGAVAQHLGTFHENVCRFAEQREAFFGTVRALTEAIDAKDPYTRGHSQRVALLAETMAVALGLGARTAERYRIAGMVHDVGKIGVPEAVLRKPGRLTDDEFALIKAHPEIGHRILRDIGAMADILPAVLHHHERFDGRGYPHRLAGESIPFIARVLTLCDTFDAMCSSRAYRKAIARDAVLAEVRRCAGSQFDPTLVPSFVALDFSDFDRLLTSHEPDVLAAA
jgi:HD-GYP domain-containing protein (c-di-GMP phosphodiesterase class II)